MQQDSQTGSETLARAPILDGADVEGLFAGQPGRDRVARVLPDWLRAQRWFAGKTREIRKASIHLLVPFSKHTAYGVVRVHYATRGSEDYAVPMCWLPDGSPLPAAHPAAVLARTANHAGFLCDATADTRFHDELYQAILSASQFEGPGATVVGMPQPQQRAGADLPSVLIAQEQSNTSIRYADRFVLKLFRKLEPGAHPDVEMARFLARPPRFANVAALAGVLELRAARTTTLGMLSAWVPHHGDAWTRVVALAENELRHDVSDSLASGQAAALHASGTAAVPRSAEASVPRHPHFSASQAIAARLGERTAALHSCLARDAADPDFTPEPLSRADCDEMLEALQRQAFATQALLRDDPQRIPQPWREAVERLFRHRPRLLERFEPLRQHRIDAVRIRCHGDLHLGQVLYQEDSNGEPDCVFLDFEGEPGRPLQARRIKSCALRDVAGMMRSLDYAAWMARRRIAAGSMEVVDDTLDSAAAWWSRTTCAAFLKSYRSALPARKARAADAGSLHIVPSAPDDFALMLDAYRFEKAMYELEYELNNRPDWVDIPLRGITEALREM